MCGENKLPEKRLVNVQRLYRLHSIHIYMKYNMFYSDIEVMMVLMIYTLIRWEKWVWVLDSFDCGWWAVEAGGREQRMVWHRAEDLWIIWTLSKMLNPTFIFACCSGVIRWIEMCHTALSALANAKSVMLETFWYLMVPKYNDTNNKIYITCVYVRKMQAIDVDKLTVQKIHASASNEWMRIIIDFWWKYECTWWAEEVSDEGKASFRSLNLSSALLCFITQAHALR